MSGRQPTPPRWARAVADWLVRGINAEFIRNDLLDDYSRHGRVTRYVRLALSSRTAMHGSAWHPGRLVRAAVDDGRFALRGLRKSPGFASVAILTLALGIGANAAIFAVVHGVLLAPLPYSQPERVVNIWQVFRDWQESEVAMFREMADRFRVSWPVYQEWTQRARRLEAVAVYASFPTIVDGLEVAEWVNVVQTTRSFIDVVGVEPELGRWFSEREDADSDTVVVVSHGYWQSRLGGDADVVGTVLRMHGSPYTVIGVMPEDFYFPRRGYDIWYPVPQGRRNDRFTSQSMAAVGRLAEGVTLADAQHEMNGIADQIIADRPEAIDAGVRLVSRVQEVAGTTAGTLRLLAAAVGLVLLVAAANVAGLLLVRTSTRRQELAVRAALGARRARLAGQLMMEGTLLSLAGGAVALLAVAATLGSLRALLPPRTPRLADIAMTWEVAAYVVLTSLFVAGLFGLMSLAYLRRERLQTGLRQTAGVVGNTPGRAVLVVGEIAVSVVLLSAALLIATSYARLTSVESGIQADGLLSLRVAAPIDLWHDHPDELSAFQAQVTQRLTALPGVRAAAAVNNLPFTGSRSSGGFGWIAEPASEDDTGWSLEQEVSAGYFDLMGIPIVAGRPLSDDPTGPREIVVNEELVTQYFPDRSPLGEILYEADGGAHVIVGVAANVRHTTLSEKIEAKRYRLFERDPDATAMYVLRVEAPPESLSAQIRTTLLDIAPGVTVSDFALMTELVNRTTALPRFRMLLLTTLALLAIALSAIGLYGVVAIAVVARRREFGLRVTLGANARQVARLVVWDGLRLTLPGIALGLLASFATNSWVASYLYGIQAADLTSRVVVAVCVALLALGAMILPARRALRVDPMVALRSD